MTKVIKLWHQFSFWMKLKSILVALGVSGEIALYMADSHESYRWVALGATILAVLITHLVEDKNKNGIADIFESLYEKAKKKKKDRLLE